MKVLPMVDVAANAASLMALLNTAVPASQVRAPSVAGATDPFSAAFAAAVVEAASTPGPIPAPLPADDAAPIEPPVTLVGNAVVPIAKPGATPAAMPGAIPGAIPGRALPVLAVRQELAALPVAALPVAPPAAAVVAKPLSITAAAPTQSAESTVRHAATASDDRKPERDVAPAPEAEAAVPALLVPAMATQMPLRAAVQTDAKPETAAATVPATRLTAQSAPRPAPIAPRAALPSASSLTASMTPATAMPRLVPADLRLTLESGPAHPSVAAPKQATPMPSSDPAPVPVPVAVGVTIGAEAQASATSPIAPEVHAALPRAEAASAQGAVSHPAPDEQTRTHGATRGETARAPVEPVMDGILAATPPAQPVATAREAGPVTAKAAPQRIDVATLVDTIARVRDEAAPAAPVAVALTHAEFGKVSLRFRHEDDGLSVAMSSADPAFAPAVAAAGQAQATPDMRQQQQEAARGDAQLRNAEPRSDTGGASSQTANSGGTRQDGGQRQDSSRATPTPSQRGNARSSRESAQQRDGIFA